MAACPEGSRWDGAACVASLTNTECPSGYLEAEAGCRPKLLDPSASIAAEEPETVGVLESTGNQNLWGDEIGEAYGTGGLGLTQSANASGVEASQIVSYGVAEANVRAVLGRVYQSLDDCYAEGDLAPTHEASFEVVLRVDSGGLVQNVTLSGGTPEFAEVKECLTRILRILDFGSSAEAAKPAGVALNLRAGMVPRFVARSSRWSDGQEGRASPTATGAPRVRVGRVTVSGRLPQEQIVRVVRANFGRFRLCYEQGLARNAALAGRVQLRFVIARDGSLSHVVDAGSDLPDSKVVRCVMNSLKGLSFPQPDAGLVVVVFPVLFEPPTLK
ncbi:MAG TPA: AgmX/PglI C-terminal domain-containing protein [Polyangiaceae bacterium]